MISPAAGRSAILLIGHGTRDSDGTNQFFELAERTQAFVGDAVTVRPCLLEFQSPTIDQAWAAMVEDGVRDVAVSPLLLFAAGHAKSDIPGAIRAAANRHGRIGEVRWCRPLSRHPAMVQLVRERLGEAIDRADRNAAGGPGPGRRMVVMVGRGSHDPCATTDMRVLAEAVMFGRPMIGQSLADRYQLDPADQRTAFYAMARPHWLDVLREVARSHPATVVVHPHLLFNGRLLQAIEKGVTDLKLEFPATHWEVAEAIGPVDGLARAVAGRADGRQGHDSSVTTDRGGCLAPG